MKTVSKAYRKKDAMQLVTGQPVYMDDLVPANCLIVKLLRFAPRQRDCQDHQYGGGQKGAGH